MKNRHRIFLLSPANLAGTRAGYVLRENAESQIARRLRQEGVSLGELFAFLSSLYFRGKLAYARAFSAPPSGLCGSYVITATAGLMDPEMIVTLDQVLEMAAGKIEADDRRYRDSFDLGCQMLCQRIEQSCDIVLLGSVATPKYVEPLLQAFGERLLFPIEFVGRGDMSRGGLMLRAVEAQTELAYTPILNATRHGARPPKLVPIRRAGFSAKLQVKLGSTTQSRDQIRRTRSIDSRTSERTT